MCVIGKIKKCTEILIKRPRYQEKYDLDLKKVTGILKREGHDLEKVPSSSRKKYLIEKSVVDLDKCHKKNEKYYAIKKWPPTLRAPLTKKHSTPFFPHLNPLFRLQIKDLDFYLTLSQKINQILISTTAPPYLS